MLNNCEKNRSGIFLLTTTVILGLVLGGMCIFGDILLTRLNEDFSFFDGIRMSQKEDSLYGRILFSRYRYKFYMGQEKKADLLVLGSSRVMQFREKFFKNISFYNAGGAMNSIQPGIDFINLLSADALPKIVILGVDMWWFTQELVYKASEFKMSAIEEFFYMRKSILLSHFFGNFKQLKFTLNSSEAHFPNRIGAPAAQLGEGHRSDGSYRYGLYLSGKIKIDYTLSDVKKRISGRYGHFEGGKAVDKSLKGLFSEFIALMKDKGIVPVVFLTPFPHEICAILEESEAHKGLFGDFKNTVRDICQQYGVEFYDFVDMKTFGASDKDIFDGLHGNERAYALLTRKMANSPVLGRFIDVEAIEKTYQPSAPDVR